MASKEIDEDYDSTFDREVRADLRQAVDLVGDVKIAIDCGCGADSDIAYLRLHGFTVHGFDVELEAIERCRKRFEGDNNVHLSEAGFNNFEYPSSSLIVADASLFFCEEKNFAQVWDNISRALMTGGMFTGSFLGPRGTMAGPAYERDVFWPDVMVFTENQLRPIFQDFDIIEWTEHKVSGHTAQGVPHDWHIFSVVAGKT